MILITTIGALGWHENDVRSSYVSWAQDIVRALGIVLLPLACSYDNPAYEAGQSGGGPTASGTGATATNGAGPGVGPDSNSATGESATASDTVGEPTETTGPPPECSDGTPASDQLCFGMPMEIPLGEPGDPMAVLAVDMDDDDDDDLLVGFVTGNLRMFLGDPDIDGLPGESSVLNPPPTQLGFPEAMVALDLDEMGLLDVLAVDGANPDGLKLMIGDTAPLGWSLLDPGPAPVSIVEGELFGDPGPDVAVVLNNQNALVIYDPATSFANVQTVMLETCSTPSDLALGDLDDDEDLDVVITCRGGAHSDAVVVVTNHGDDMFSVEEGMSYPDTRDTDPVAVVVEDYDGDRLPDVLVTRRAVHEVALYRNDGSGGLLDPVIRPVGMTPEDLAVDDFDGDGDLDIVVACFDGRQLDFLLQPESGGLGSPESIDLLGQPYSLAVGYFNEDDLPDLVVSLPTPGSLEPAGLVAVLSDP